MEYEELYDESPYTSKEDPFTSTEVPRRGGKMNSIRATFMVCVTILASVFGVIFYDFTQDQYVVTTGGNFVSIFDKKTQGLNVCTNGRCHLVKPHFERKPSMLQSVLPQGTPTAHHHRGHAGTTHHLGSFPQQQRAPQITPQMLQQIQQRRAIENQQLANNQLTPQMIQQIQQRRAHEDKLIAQSQNPQMAQQTTPAPQQMMQQQSQPQMMNPQMAAGAAQPQYTAASPQQQAAPSGPVSAPEADDEEEEAAPV